MTKADIKPTTELLAPSPLKKRTLTYPFNFPAISWSCTASSCAATLSARPRPVAKAPAPAAKFLGVHGDSYGDASAMRYF